MIWSIDHREEDREEVPQRCPHCGALLELVELYGEWWVHGPADRKAALKQGADAEDGDIIFWVGLNAHCPACHWSWSVAVGKADT